MIKDWNRNELYPMEVFHFKNSLRPFVVIEKNDGDYLFVDINNQMAYSFEELEFEGLEFFQKPNDDDFLGVSVNGILKWIAEDE